MISHDTSSIFGDAFEWRASFDCILKADGWATFCRCLTRKSGPLKLCLHKIRFFQPPLTAFYDQCQEPINSLLPVPKVRHFGFNYLAC